MNLRGIYQTSIVCLPPRHGCTWSVFLGPYSFDLMSLYSNCQRDRIGNALPHFTTWPTRGSAEVNVFAKPLPARQNIYVFPHFVLIGPLLRYIFSHDFHDVFTSVVPDFHTRPFWWAPLQVWAFRCVCPSDLTAFVLCYSFPGCKNLESRSTLFCVFESK